MSNTRIIAAIEVIDAGRLTPAEREQIANEAARIIAEDKKVELLQMLDDVKGQVEQHVNNGTGTAKTKE